MKNWTWRQCQTVLDQPAPSALTRHHLILGRALVEARRGGRELSQAVLYTRYFDDLGSTVTPSVKSAPEHLHFVRRSPS
jgi:hypothetical protein